MPPPEGQFFNVHFSRRDRSEVKADGEERKTKRRNVAARKVLNLRVANCSCRGNFISWSGNSRPRIESPVTTPQLSLIFPYPRRVRRPQMEPGCFALNLLRGREFLPSPISPYFVFIIVISIHPMARPIFHPPPSSSSISTRRFPHPLCPFDWRVYTVFIKFA